MVRALTQGEGRRRLAWAPMVLAAALCLAGCKPPEAAEPATPTPIPAATPAPSPTPEPTPAPLYIPSKHLDVGRLFNGVQIQTALSTEPGGSATAEAAAPDSYKLRLNLSVRIPRAVTTRDGLAKLNPALPTLFPALDKWLGAAHASPLYERLYRHKVQSLQRDLLRLDLLLGRHDLFDCETMLEFESAATPAAPRRKVLWIQSDMDVDNDGSDADRVPGIDATSPTFQPLTSYKWPKRGPTANPFAAQRAQRLGQLEASMAHASGPQREMLKQAADATRYEMEQLKKYSFLVGAADPYIVVPGSVYGQRDDPYAPGIGDYCVVVYGTSVYPAIVGDVGPMTKVGEASLRIAQAINPRATSENRPVSPLKVSYLIFPGSADHPFAPPDLAHWHSRVDALLREIGGCAVPLHAWVDLTAPPPTPTPAPSSPAASPSPGSIPSPASSASASPAAAVTRVVPAQ